MRSQLLLRRTRTLIKPPSFAPRALLSSTHVPRYPRKEISTRAAGPRLSKRSSSSASPLAPEADPDDPDDPEAASDPPAEPTDPEPVAEVEKPKRRTRASSSKDAEATPGLPSGLDILWVPKDELLGDPSSSGTRVLSVNTALPPPEIFHEVLTNLHITLHPQTQHRATYASTAGPLVEPTFALYCPIEGGDYIIDETVRELGRKAGAEVVVLDSVQLAAGECGQFGKGESRPS